MATPGPTESAAERAAHWAVLATYGEMTPENRVELETWLAADDRHVGAYARARAGLYAMEDAVIEAGPDPASRMRKRPVPTDACRPLFRYIRPAVTGGLALAASLAAFLLLGVPTFSSGPADAVMQVVTLKDGSIATLRENAKMEFALADGARKVTLLSGEATFKVAKDKAHPFVVRSGDVYAQATGTVYSVGRVGQTGGTVSVTEGSVLVWARDERDQAVLLHAGGTLTLDPGPDRPTAKARSAAPLPPPELAQISLDNVPIRSAVVRFNRVNDTKIVVADQAIGDTRIVGLFRANDPEQFARSAATITGALVERNEKSIVIKMK